MPRTSLLCLDRLSRTILSFFFSNHTSTTDIYTLSLHDALPIFLLLNIGASISRPVIEFSGRNLLENFLLMAFVVLFRSEEHTSELQSLRHLVCRLLLEKKKKIT